MLSIQDRFRPTWLLLPINHNTTAWRPFGLPMVLCVPDGMKDGRVFNVRIAIEDAPRFAKVAGHDNIGKLVPDYELYARNINDLELSDREISLDTLDYYDSTDTATDRSNASYFKYTCAAGVTDDIEFLEDASYYDISDILIDVADLQPDNYRLTYKCNYYSKVTNIFSGVEYRLCTEDTIATAEHEFRLNHPGDVIQEIVKLTPSIYFEDAEKDVDSTIGFYRPFADALQDVFDEQWFIEKSNWVSSISPEHVPYLAYLLGVDVPYFPRSVNNLRNVMLKKASRLQKVKGSRRALTELFEVFGYSIYVANLWWSSDGKRYIRPGEKLPDPYSDEEIQISEVCHTEPLLANYTDNGFGNISIPLMYRPQTGIVDGAVAEVNVSVITIDSYLVEVGSAAFDDLTAISEGFGSCDISAVSLTGVIGRSTVTIDNNNKEEAWVGIPPIKAAGAKYDKVTNQIKLVFDSYIEFTPIPNINPYGVAQALFSFATYNRIETIIPSALDKLNSNKFDVVILTKEGDQVASDVVDFLIDYVYKLKAFHSILRAFRYTFEINDIYTVTNTCVGYDFPQRRDTDLGKQQVPPAIIPIDGNACLSPSDLGYKESDILYRERVFDGATNEFDTDCENGQSKLIAAELTTESTFEFHPGPQANSDGLREAPNTGTALAANSDTGAYGRYRVETDSPNTTLCSNPKQDYCFEGRVSDAIMYQTRVALDDHFNIRTCANSLGVGYYYINSKLTDNKNTKLIGISGSFVKPQNRNNLGRLLGNYQIDNANLMYTNRVGCTQDDINDLIAINRPNLQISVPTMGMPGCRFPTMGNLENDYVSTWSAKPWDSQYSTSCNIKCRTEPSWLNGFIDTNGDLVFDEAYFIADGNGIAPDITNMSSQESDYEIIQRIYSSAIDNHAAITCDSVTFESATTDFIVDNPIFSTASQCGSYYEDHIDGYKAPNSIDTDADIDRSGLFAELIDEMGLTSSSTGINVLFTLNSGILIGDGMRLDCGCSRIDCNSTEVLSCTVQPEPDVLELDYAIELEEVGYANGYVLDGAITCMI